MRRCPIDAPVAIFKGKDTRPESCGRCIIDTFAVQALARFTSNVHAQPIFLPDLTAWYEWHARENTLPAPTLREITGQLNLPLWSVAKPWSAKTHNTEIRTEERDGARVTTYSAGSGELTARWTVGPDGDYWQTEYPAKTVEDLQVVLEIVEDRVYTLTVGGTSGPGGTHSEGREVTTVGLSAVKLPPRPPSMLIYEFLGLSEGLMLLWDAPDLIEDILDVLETRLQELIPAMAGLPETLVVSPDNLDAQFISADMCRNRIAPSYARTAKILHAAQKKLIVHAGGPVGNLLQELRESGIDGIQGIAGPPQGDTDFATAREKAGPDIALWGGISQDFLLDTYDTAAFEAAVRQAADAARNQSRIILGVADQVPPQASLDRLKSIPALIEG